LHTLLPLQVCAASMPHEQPGSPMLQLLPAEQKPSTQLLPSVQLSVVAGATIVHWQPAVPATHDGVNEQTLVPSAFWLHVLPVEQPPLRHGQPGWPGAQSGMKHLLVASHERPMLHRRPAGRQSQPIEPASHGGMLEPVVTSATTIADVFACGSMLMGAVNVYGKS